MIRVKGGVRGQGAGEEEEGAGERSLPCLLSQHVAPEVDEEVTE